MFRIYFFIIALQIYYDIFIYKKYFLERLHIHLHRETLLLETTAIMGNYLQWADVVYLKGEKPLYTPSVPLTEKETAEKNLLL